MTTFASNHSFQPQSPDAAGVVSWIHHLDLEEIVNEVNRTFTGSAGTWAARHSARAKQERKEVE